MSFTPQKYEHQGKRLTIRQWSQQPAQRTMRLTYRLIKSRLEKSWPVSRALTEPTNPPLATRTSSVQGRRKEIAL